jgi:hypothetical protein
MHTPAPKENRASGLRWSVALPQLSEASSEAADKPYTKKQAPRTEKRRETGTSLRPLRCGPATYVASDTAAAG